MQGEKLGFLPLGAPPPPPPTHSRIFITPASRGLAFGLLPETRWLFTQRPDSQGVWGMEGCGPCLTPPAKLPSRSALRGRPGTRWALPPPAAPGPPPPAPDSLSSTPIPSRPSPPHSDKRDNLLPSCRSRRPRSKATASGNHTDTITTLTSQKPLRPGPGPKTRKQTPSSFAALQRPRQRPIRSRQGGSRRDDNKGRGRNGPGGGHLKSVP